MTILFICPKEDKQLKILLKKASHLNIDTSHIDLSNNIDLKYSFEDGKTDALCLNKNLDSFNGIYFRNTVDTDSYNKSYSIQELTSQQEKWNFLFPINNFSKNSIMNSPLYNLKIENKINQLHLATKIGFELPETLISNNINSVKNFVSNNKKYIYKPLGLQWNENNTQQYTKFLNIDDHGIKFDLPAIYQKYIKRKSEFRIYVIGNSLIPIEMKFDETYDDIPDSRLVSRHSLPKFSLTNISDNLAKKLQQFNREANITYAAYDFIQDSSDNMFFLECNPNGNWMYLPDKFTDLISTEIVSFLNKV